MHDARVLAAHGLVGILEGAERQLHVLSVQGHGSADAKQTHTSGSRRLKSTDQAAGWKKEKQRTTLDPAAASLPSRLLGLASLCALGATEIRIF